MRRLFGMMLLLAALASGKTVTKTFARITNVVISGPAEHTLVIQPSYPSYTRHYTATWEVEYYDADVEVPDDDDDDDEENEQENGGGDGGDVVFSTSVEWCISGAGAAFAEGSDTTAAEIDVVFTEGNIEDVHLTLQLHCICTAGDGVGDDHAAEFTIHSPVWDTYHPIGMYVTPCRILAPRVVGVGDPVHLQILDFCNNEYDRRVGADVQTPLDFLRTLWSLPAGFSSATTAYALTVTASGTAQNGVVGAAIDDVAPAIPANERGTRDDSAVPLESVPITVVEVASLTSDIGVEVDDGDDNPDTKTFLVPKTNNGQITITATPNPGNAWPSGYPIWKLNGSSSGTAGSSTYSLDTSASGMYSISASCGTSVKTISIAVVEVIIKNGNTDITNKQQKVIVGQKITLSAVIQPSILPANINNKQWTLPGKRIKNYVADEYLATITQISENDLKSDSIEYYWYDKGEHTVAYTCRIGTQSITGQTEFSVEKPVSTLTATKGGSIGIISENGKILLRFGSLTNPGISFSRTVTIPKDFGGTAVYWQKVNGSIRTIKWRNNQTSELYAINALDTCIPYSENEITSDSPGNRLNNQMKSIRIVDDFTMFVMFKPNSSDSIWIPLRSINWSWTGTALKNQQNVWQLDDANTSNATGKSIETDEFPTWDGNIKEFSYQLKSEE